MISSLEFPRAQVTDLEQIHELVDELCRHQAIDESTCYALRLCIEEAFVNVVDHGYPNDKPGPITVTLKQADRAVHAIITDRAPAFHPEHAPQPDLDLGWDERQIGGLGWHFIREMMDEVRYETDEKRGNALTLVKYLFRARETKSGRLEITVSMQGDIALVALGGKIDALSAPSVNELLKKQLQGNRPRLVVELTRVTYISSAGVFALLNTLKEARARGGDLRVADAPKDVHKVLELAGFFDLSEHFSSVDQATASFSAPKT